MSKNKKAAADKAVAKKPVKAAKTRKRLSKKQQIMFSIGGGVLGLAAIIGALIYSQTAGSQTAEANSYQTVTIQKADDLLFNGSVIAQNTQEFYLDQTKGEITDILVTNGQEITAATAVLTYQNETVQDQVDEQQQTLEKLNLAVTSAQQNVNSAVSQKQDLQNKLNTATKAYNNANANTPEGQATRQEEKAKMEQYEESIRAQADVITQAEQALTSANIDLANANQSIENARSKVTTNETAGIDGIVIVDEKGKSDPTTAVVKIISKETLVEAKISEYDYQRLAKDQSVTVRPANSSKEVPGTVMEINELPDAAATAAGTSQTATVANYSFKVKPGETLHYGYSCQVALPVDELRIPEKAIRYENGQQYAFVYADGKVVKTAITAEEREGVFVVTNGLQENDQVIAEPAKDLQDGQEVTVS